jgi:hypothetical protein
MLDAPVVGGNGVAGGDLMACEKFSCRHRSSSLELQFENLDDTGAGGNMKVITVSGNNGSRQPMRLVHQCRRTENNQPLPS